MKPFGPVQLNSYSKPLELKSKGIPPVIVISIDPVFSPKHKISTESSKLDSIGVDSVISNISETGPQLFESYKNNT